MVNLYVDNQSLNAFRAQTLISQAQGDFEDGLSTINSSHQAVQDAHQDYYSRLADLNDQYAPPSQSPAYPQADSVAAAPQTRPSPAGGAAPESSQQFSPYDAVFRKYAGDLANDPEFIKIVAAGTKAESGWNPSNTTGDGGHSWGLFQMHDQGAGAGMGSSRLDPDVASSRMVPAYAAAYKQYANSGLTGDKLAAAVAQAAEKSADPTGSLYAKAYREISGGDVAGPPSADTTVPPATASGPASWPSIGGGSPTESSSIQTPQQPAQPTAADVIRQANDDFTAGLSQLNLNQQPQQQGGPPQMPGVPNIFSPPQNAQEAVQAAQDLAMNTPKPLFGPGGLGAGDPRIGPNPLEDSEEAAVRGPADDILASAADEGATGRPLFGRGGAPQGGKYVKKEVPEPTNPEELDQKLQDMLKALGKSDQEIADIRGEPPTTEAAPQTPAQAASPEANTVAPVQPVQPAEPGAPPPAQMALPDAEAVPQEPSPVPYGPPDPQVAQTGQLPLGLYPDDTLPYSAPQAMPPVSGESRDVQPGQLSLGLDALFGGDQQPWAKLEIPKITVEGNPVWAAMAQGKQTIFSLTPFHNISIGWGTLFGPAGPSGFAKYMAAQVNPGYFNKAYGDLAEWVARADKWPGMNVGGANPEAGQFTMNPVAAKAVASGFGGVGSFGTGYTSAKIEGQSDEDAFRRGLLLGGLGAILGPTAGEALHQALWGRGVPLAKVLTFKSMVEAGASEAEAARFTRNLMGGGQLEEIASSQGTQRAVRLAVMAPDWVISQFRLAGDVAAGAAKSVPGAENVLGRMTANQAEARNYWVKTVGAGMIATEALQLALTGHTTDQNQAGDLFALEIPNADGKSVTHLSLLPGNVEPIMSLLDNAATGGNHPEAQGVNRAFNAAGSFISNRAGIAPRILGQTLANQRYFGGPNIVKPGTPATQAALPEAAQAASNIGSIGIQTPIQESERGAPLPAYLASAFGIKTGERTTPAAQRRTIPQLGAPQPKTPWEFLRDVATGVSTRQGQTLRRLRP